MCLITFAYNTHSQYRLVMAANRDESYSRPAVSAHFWDDHPDILAGRDLKKMGTWMGVTKNGRFAAITNYREPSLEMADAKSRGHLVSDYLSSSESPENFLVKVEQEQHAYNGFNLIVGNQTSMFYFSNHEDRIEQLDSGVYGLSNATLDTPWPKVVKSKKHLKQCFTESELDSECLFGILADTEKAQDQQLPHTGIGMERERALSPVFIQTEGYGTRASTLLLIDYHDHVYFKERTFTQGQQNSGQVYVDFQMDL